MKKISLSMSVIVLAILIASVSFSAQPDRGGGEATQEAWSFAGVVTGQTQIEIVGDGEELFITDIVGQFDGATFEISAYDPNSMQLIAVRYSNWLQPSTNFSEHFLSGIKFNAGELIMVMRPIDAGKRMFLTLSGYKLIQ